MSAAPGGEAARGGGRLGRAARRAGLALAALALLSAPWWGRRALAQLDFFRVRRIEIVGARYLRPAEVIDRLRVDTTRSVWDALAPLERRVAEHPQVAGVAIDRRLPGTLVVRVQENLPVALAPAADGLVALDAAGTVLPIDPSRTPVDLPVVARRDTLLLRLLADVRRAEPGLFARISEVRRVGAAELLLQLRTVPVRAMVDVSVDRLAELTSVEHDLERRQARVAEIDLRYHDQVIARLQ